MKAETLIKKENKAKQLAIENPMRSFKIEKIILSSGATGQDLEKAAKLLSFLTGKKPEIIASKRRIPDFDVSPGLEVGTRVTLRGEEALALLRKLLGAIDNTILAKQVSDNHFSFGIKEYIEIPGIEYQREIGIRGFNITVVFSRPGLRVKRKKIKSGNIPKRHYIKKEEIIRYMEENFNTKIK